MVSPKHLVTHQRTPIDSAWVIRTRNPFLLLRVQQQHQQSEENTFTLSPWPVAAFHALPAAKQIKLIQSAGSAWLVEAGFARVVANRANCQCNLVLDLSPPSMLFATANGVRYVISPAEPVIAAVTKTGSLVPILTGGLDENALNLRIADLHLEHHIFCHEKNN